MNYAITSNSALSAQPMMQLLRSDKLLAASSTFLLHLIAIVLLLAGWQEKPLIVPKNKIVKLNIVMQAPVEAPIETPVEMLTEAPVQKPVKAMELEPPKPIKKDKPKPVIEKAAFAKKRVDKRPEPPVQRLIEEQVPEPLVYDTLPIEPNLVEADMSVESTKPTQRSVTNMPKSQDNGGANNLANANFDASQYFPIEKHPPTYPRRALNKEIEGECTVRYTVNTEGRVESPEVLAGCHAFFIKASLEATKSFRYTPRVVNGKAVSVKNVRNTFQYRIE